MSEEVRFIKCTREQYERLMKKESNSFYVTSDDTKEEETKEEETDE